MKRLSLGDRISLMGATLFGVGYIPLCPGTVACIVGVGVFLLVKNPVAFLVVAFISLGLSFLLTGRAEEIFDQKDCKKIVIDDFSGMLITFLFIPPTIYYIVCGFFLFRMLDVLKIPPADIVERFSGAKGIVGDDVVAGIYANLILQAVRLLLAIFS